MNTIAKIKIQKSAIKIFVAVVGVGLTAYCGFLCCGFRNDIAEFIAMTLGYLIIAGGAWVYKLCWLSWTFLTYAYVVRCCMIAQRADLFGEYLDEAHLLVFLIGVALCYLFLRNIDNYLKDF